MKRGRVLITFNKKYPPPPKESHMLHERGVKGKSPGGVSPKRKKSIGKCEAFGKRNWKLAALPFLMKSIPDDESMLLATETCSKTSKRCSADQEATIAKKSETVSSYEVWKSSYNGSFTIVTLQHAFEQLVSYKYQHYLADMHKMDSHCDKTIVIKQQWYKIVSMAKHIDLLLSMADEGLWRERRLWLTPHHSSKQKTQPKIILRRWKLQFVCGAENHTHTHTHLPGSC